MSLANSLIILFQKLANAKKPLIIIGSDAIQGKDGSAVHAQLQKLAAKLRAGNGIVLISYDILKILF